MTKRGDILTATKTALSGLSLSPVLYETFSDVLQAGDQRSLVIGPGNEERLETAIHNGRSVRAYPVRVVCTAWTREEADTMAFEVEAALVTGPAAERLGARLTGSNFTESSDKSERIYFSTIVNFDVLYETTAA